MDKNAAGEIMREFGASRSTAGRNDTRWKWDGTPIFYPDAICPWCGGAMHSTRIWLVDEHANELKGQIAIVDGKEVLEPPEHPHVNGGKVCADKSGRSLQDALFLGMNTASMYWHLADPRMSDADIKKRYRHDPYTMEGMLKGKAKWCTWLKEKFNHVCGESTVKAGLSLSQTESAELKAERQRKAQLEADRLLEAKRHRRASITERLFNGRPIAGQPARPTEFEAIFNQPDPAGRKQPEREVEDRGDDTPIFGNTATGLNLDRL